jgi:outer membrane protein insertion porin family
VRLGTFLDAGQVWNPSYGNGSLGKLGVRYSTGLTFSWVSPIGPLQLSLGYPLAKRSGDRLQHFQFSLGTVF